MNSNIFPDLTEALRSVANRLSEDVDFEGITDADALEMDLDDTNGEK